MEGDIALRGRPPTLFQRYWEHRTRRPPSSGRLVRQGDRAIRDEDGYFWFTGRSDNVILSAAYRIGPFEVESALLEHSAVAESAVVGKPDPDRGQIVKAFVVLRPGYQPSRTGRRAEDTVAGDGAVQVPARDRVLATLPKTRSGKIRRVELRQLEEQRAGRTPTLIAIVEPPARRRPRSRRSPGRGGAG